jgi:hypothetical protein
MFPITFWIPFYSSEIPTYRKEIKGRKYNQSYGKLWKYVMNPAMSIHLIDKLDKLMYNLTTVFKTDAWFMSLVSINRICLPKCLVYDSSEYKPYMSG